jgi:(4S)-4-hydroxy-5-phosphonooxypentane-2,3-dione isomerase
MEKSWRREDERLCGVSRFSSPAGALETFRELVEINARQSAQMEPGCRRFDVIEPHGAADAILLYEVYRNRTDFDARMRSEHYARFDAASAALFVSKSVHFGALVCEGST